MPDLQLVRRDTGWMDDAEIKALARGDRRRAIDLVVRKYRDRLFRHALYVVKDQEEAIDVCQDVFIKALREPRFFEADFKMKAWLFRVTSNQCFNIVRDRRRRGAILDAMPQQLHTSAEQVELVFGGEQQHRMLAAMDRLTEAHREILTLRYYSDLSYAEIADVLGVALGTVMSRLNRAKSSLVEVLELDGVLEG
jgi:RNA polymerase sigma-70 factor, ECF subfamily